MCFFVATEDRIAAGTAPVRKCRPEYVDDIRFKFSALAHKLERAGLRDVETIEKPVPDKIEVRRQGCTCFTLKRAQCVKHATGFVLRRKELPSSTILPHRGDQPVELGRRPRGHRGRTAQQPEQVSRREACPVPNVREEVSFASSFFDPPPT
jgi:hypothetical protein